MKKLYLELFIFLLALCTFIFFIEWQVKDVKAPIDRLLLQSSEKPSAKWLIIGNSHTGVLSDVNDTAFLNTIINVSLADLELADRYKVLQNCLKGTNIKTVILGMDADQLGHDFSSSDYDRQLYKYGFDLHENKLGNHILARLNFFRLHLSVSDLVKLIADRDKIDTAKTNFIPFSNKARNDLKACRKRAEKHSIFSYKKEHNKKNLQYLQQIIDLCKGKKINIFLLQTPKTACYSNIYDTEKMKVASELIDSSALKNNVQFLNYFNSPYFSDSDFADFDHLNEQGSLKLLSMLKSKISGE